MLHERADAGRPESRDGMRVLRSVQIGSVAEGLHGVADVVEMRGPDPYPVEYKRGRPKAHRVDEVQLCAQALCLEEMTGREVPEGALFYGQRRRRSVVAMDADLRALTRRTASEARASIAAGILPPPVFKPARCGACSLAGLCRPEGRRAIGPSWLTQRLDRAGIPE